MSTNFTRVKFKRKSRSLTLEEPEENTQEVVVEEEVSYPVTSSTQEVTRATLEPATTPVPFFSDDVPPTDADNIHAQYPFYNPVRAYSRDYVDEVGNRWGTLGSWLYAVLYRNRDRYRSFPELLAEVRHLAEGNSRQPKDIRSALRLYLTTLPKLKNFRLLVMKNGRRGNRSRYRLDYTSVAYERRKDAGSDWLFNKLNTLPTELR